MATNAFKVLVIGPIHERGMALLRERSDVAVEVIDVPTAEQIAARIEDADGVVLRTAPLRGDLVDRARRLKVVSRHGVGYDNVDLEALSRRRIPLTITADANAIAVAEHTLYLMLALAKRGPGYDRATRAGEWAARNRLDRVELCGRRVLILGFGRIGREVALRCEAFGMEVSVYDPYVDHETIGRAGYHPVDDFRAELPRTHVLSVHTPLTGETSHMIGRAELGMLAEHAFVLNASRGGIVDEVALLEALQTGRLAGAGLDVLEDEPPARDHPLLALDNVVLSPHAAGLTQESAVRMAVSCARNLLAGLDGKLDLSMVVNPEVLQLQP